MPRATTGQGCGIRLGLLFYLFLTSSSFFGAMLGECLPRDAPETAACDLSKNIDFVMITVLALFGLVAAGIIARRSAARGVIALLLLSFLPMLLSILTSRVIYAWR